MEYPEVTSQQRDSIISLASDAEVIRKFARSLTDRLIAVFRDSEVKYHLEVEIDPDTESSLGHLLIKSALATQEVVWLFLWMTLEFKANTCLRSVALILSVGLHGSRLGNC
ncbi:hypothetical protein ACFQD2_00490 [Pseudomonas lini]